MKLSDYPKLYEQGLSPDRIYKIIRADAAVLSGGLDDTHQRAIVYHHIYAVSGGNFIFALIAAHGALWAEWYLKAARFAAHIMNFIDFTGTRSRAARMTIYTAFVDALKTINRDVLIETYSLFHFTRLFGRHAIIEEILPEPLLSQLLQCHEHAKTGTRSSLSEHRSFYENFFRWEQERVVGTAVDKAFQELNWPLMNWFCRRPWVTLSYFKFGRSLVFRDFTKTEERVQKGLGAFDKAAIKGWERVEARLKRNRYFPKIHYPDPALYFNGLKSALTAQPKCCLLNFCVTAFQK